VFLNFLYLLILFSIIMFSFGYGFQIYLDNVYFKGKVRFLSFFEKLVYKYSGVDPLEKGDWKLYLSNIIKLSIVSGFFTFLILIFQGSLPLNPNHMKSLDPLLALNITISFLTQTDWQAYSGELQLSYLAQTVALGLQYFFAPAVAIAVGVGVIRSITKENSDNFGSFWVDFTKSILYVLLPLSFLFAIILIATGTIQNYLPNIHLTTLEGSLQTLPMGPVASQVAIKMFGGNGGGFFNGNSAHPFESPNELSLIFQFIFLILIPSSMILLLGNKTNFIKHGVSVWFSFFLLLSLFMSIIFINEMKNTGILNSIGNLNHFNMEGKEIRLGTGLTALFNCFNTATSTGAMAGSLDSFSPLAGGVSLFLVMLGSIVFGGAGTGLYGIFIYIVITVFICGLMVGRTPEYIGKRIEDYEIKWAILSLLFIAVCTLVGPAIALNFKWGVEGISVKGPHGLSQILYAFSSTASNNGSAFGGLNATHPGWLVSTSISMLIGRFGCIVPALAIASSLSAKKRYAINEMSFPVYGVIFVMLLSFVVLIVGGLTYMPAVVLGPISEFVQLMSEKQY